MPLAAADAPLRGGSGHTWRRDTASRHAPEPSGSPGRRTTVHASRKLLLALTVALAGCGGGDDVAAPAPQNARLVVESTYSPGRDGVLYTEGALLEVVLTAPDGETQTQQGPVEEDLVFDGLPVGRYVVRPALRPCAGNCGHLDDRTDECEAVVELRDTTRVRVDTVVAEPCTVVPVE